MDVNQHKNLLILYDAIGTLADSVGHHLNHPVNYACVMHEFHSDVNNVEQLLMSDIYLGECELFQLFVRGPVSA